MSAILLLKMQNLNLIMKKYETNPQPGIFYSITGLDLSNIIKVMKEKETLRKWSRWKESEDMASHVVYGPLLTPRP